MTTARKAIPRAQWHVTIDLEGGPPTDDPPIELRYSDSYFAGEPSNVGALIVAAMEERAEKLTRKRKRK